MRDQRIRILNIANMNSDSGVACFLMNYLRAMDMKKFRMDFVCWDKREDNCYAEIKKMAEGELQNQQPEIDNMKKLFDSIK